MVDYNHPRLRGLVLLGFPGEVCAGDSQMVADHLKRNMGDIKKTLRPVFRAVLWIRIRMFLGLLDPDQSLLVRTRNQILPSTSKKSKTNLDFYCFFDFLYLKTDINVPSNRNKLKNFLKYFFFVCILSATDEKGRIRIRIRKSVIRNRGYGSIP